MIKLISTATAIVVFSLVVVILTEKGGQFHPLSAEREERLEQLWRLNAIVEATHDDPLPMAFDPWGTQLLIQEEGDLRRTISAGPDKVFGTEDDLPYASDARRAHK